MKAHCVCRMAIVLSALFLTSCLEHAEEEREMRLHEGGWIFERYVQRDLFSSETNTAKIQKDFADLIKKCEPPITTNSPDPGIPGRVIVRRELVQQSGSLDLLEEAMYSQGFQTPVLASCVSNGWFWINFETSSFDLVCNGEIVDCISSGQVLVARWPISDACIWYKRRRHNQEGVRFTSMYEQFLAAGRKLPWPETNATPDQSTQ